jgi:hypothetical protein
VRLGKFVADLSCLVNDVVSLHAASWAGVDAHQLQPAGYAGFGGSTKSGWLGCYVATQPANEPCGVRACGTFSLLGRARRG